MDSDYKTTSLGKWSVALALIPTVGVLLLLLPILLGNYNSGEAGLGALLAIGSILYGGAHIVVATSFFGSALGLFAVCKSHYKQGIPGLLLNLAALILSGSFLITIYYSAAIDPNRLPLAASHGDYKTVEKLLERGFDVNWLGPGETTALSNAAGRGYEDIVALLLAHGADVHIGNPIGGAAMNGNEKIVRMLLDRGASPDGLDGAIYGRHPQIAEILINHGANINQRIDDSGRTPLQSAVEKGVEDIVKLLINKGANVNAKNDRGETPLHILVGMWPQHEWPENFRSRAVAMLVDAGADIETKTVEGKTPLCVAAEVPFPRRTEAIRLLLEHGANPENIKDVFVKFTAAPITMDKSKLESWVHSNAPDINVTNSKGQSLLHCAVRGDNKNLLNVLLSMGANINVQDNTGDTPLHWVLRDPNIDVVKLLINKRADLNIQNNLGQTPLHVLVRPLTLGDEKLSYQSEINACQLLLENGANVEIFDKQGRTPITQQEYWHPQGKEGRECKEDQIIQVMQKYQKSGNLR